MPSVAVIGAGFSGLAAAAYLAKEGFSVTVYEKNSLPGGRARKFHAQGFTFDMGPSWYWMPDVFEDFFKHFGKSTADYYTLDRLDPSYRIYYGKDDYLDIPAGIEKLELLFDTLQSGSSRQLKKFLAEGKYKYDLGIHKLVHKPGRSIFELIDFQLFAGLFKLHVLKSIATYIRKFFTHPRLIQLLEFPVLFLGSTPAKTPALYSLMNYADMALGTWYPQGGMHKIIEGMEALGKSLGVNYQYNCPIDSFEINLEQITGVQSLGKTFHHDYVIASADYHHIEQQILPKAFRVYSNAYWQKKTMAPSCLLFFLGVNKKIPNLLHHTLFFDQDFGQHAHEIYENPRWPSAPQFYISCPSKTDATVAPAGQENILILIPIAPGLHDDEQIRKNYYDQVITRLEKMIGEPIKDHVIFKKSYSLNDFQIDYNAFKGNAYGLANTLMQTANLRPSIKNAKLKNLYYAGQLTVPGPGVPPSLISGQVVARELVKQHNS